MRSEEDVGCPLSNCLIPLRQVFIQAQSSVILLFPPCAVPGLKCVWPIVFLLGCWTGNLGPHAVQHGLNLLKLSLEFSFLVFLFIFSHRNQNHSFSLFFSLSPLSSFLFPPALGIECRASHILGKCSKLGFWIFLKFLLQTVLLTYILIPYLFFSPGWS